MDFLLPDNNAALHIQHTLPLHLAKYAIAGAQCRYKQFTQGEYLTQLILGNDYSVWVHYFFIKREVKLFPYTADNIISLHYLIEGNISSILQGFGDIALEKGKYHLFYVPGQVKHEAVFAPGFYHCLHINFHPVYLQHIARQYPLFEPMLSRAVAGIKTGYQHAPAVVTPQVMDIIQQMLHNSLPPAERTLLVESCIRHLLRLYIQELTIGPYYAHITNAQQKLMRYVEEYIDRHLDKDIRVDAIAKQFRISRSWLQQVSKNVTGKGIHGLVKKRRMETAAKLLLETDHPVSTIVVMTSDMTFAAFTAAFREYHGLSPLEYRRLGGQKP
jgi:AraC-like DNA-binding protein